MSFLVFLLSLLDFSFGSIVNKEWIGKPRIDVCASGSCVEGVHH